MYLFVRVSLYLLKLGPPHHTPPYYTNNIHPYPYPILPLSLLKLDQNDPRPKPPRAETTHLLRPKWHPKNWPKQPGFSVARNLTCFFNLNTLNNFTKIQLIKFCVRLWNLQLGSSALQMSQCNMPGKRGCFSFLLIFLVSLSNYTWPLKPFKFWTKRNWSCKPHEQERADVSKSNSKLGNIVFPEESF